MDAGDVPEKVNGRGAHVRLGSEAAPVCPRSLGHEHDPPSSDQQQRQNAADFLPSVTLPKDGGAIHGIGEKFSVNAATGTGSLSIPLPFSPGRLAPQLQLAYDSGSGNGPFGFGWSLGLPAITRKTDKGLPGYCDGDESDVFILAAAEDLVPILDGSGARKQLTRKLHGTSYRIFFYRPRIEGLFSRIERWVAQDTDITHWRTIARDNVTALYGLDPLSRTTDPDDPRKIFYWRICRSWDTKGNLALYDYIAEDSAGIDPTAAHEANRTKAGRAAQNYLATIRYGNLQPYFPDGSADGNDAALPKDYAFKVVFDYGDHALVGAKPTPDRPWPVCPDPFSNYRAAFEIRTYRRAQRILFFNNFRNEAGVGADCLVRSLDFVYSDQQSSADPHNPISTLLVSATQTGYRQSGGSVVTRSLPPLEFAYSEPEIQPDVMTLDGESHGNLPEGLDGERFRWVDLDGEGLSGILNDTGGSWLYKRNLSANNLGAQLDGSLATHARFGPLETVAALPTNTALRPPQRLLDLGGAGRLDVVALSGPNPGFYKRTEDADLEPFKRFRSLPEIDWSDPNVKLIDVTGDGLADILVTEEGLFTFHTGLGEEGFSGRRSCARLGTRRKAPRSSLPTAPTRFSLPT
jgi:hypothetical protein